MAQLHDCDDVGLYEPEDQNEVLELRTMYCPLGSPHPRLTRAEWIALAYMARGKSLAIAAGRYAFQGENDHVNPAWSAQLCRIADTILEHFQPGDGNL